MRRVAFGYWSVAALLFACYAGNIAVILHYTPASLDTESGPGIRSIATLLGLVFVVASLIMWPYYAHHRQEYLSPAAKTYIKETISRELGPGQPSPRITRRRMCNLRRPGQAGWIASWAFARHGNGSISLHPSDYTSGRHNHHNTVLVYVGADRRLHGFFFGVKGSINTFQPTLEGNIAVEQHGAYNPLPH